MGLVILDFVMRLEFLRFEKIPPLIGDLLTIRSRAQEIKRGKKKEVKGKSRGLD